MLVPQINYKQKMGISIVYASFVGSPVYSTPEYSTPEYFLLYKVERHGLCLAFKHARTIFNPVGSVVSKFCWCHSFKGHCSIHIVELSSLFSFL